MTPVKYHGGRNYKISTYRNPRPQLAPVCQGCPLIKPSQVVSSLSFFPSPLLPTGKPNLSALGLAFRLRAIPAPLLIITRLAAL